MVRFSTLLLGMFVLALLLGLALPAMADEAKGKVKTVNGDKSEFVMTDSTGKDVTIHLNQTGKVFINDKQGKLTDLQAGDQVIVTCEIKNEQHQASEVRATRQNK
jgi:cold shock CspA family protein